MRKALATFVAAGLLSASAASAHIPEGAVWLAWQWPTSALPTLDGDLSEWQVVPNDFVIDQFTPGPDGSPGIGPAEGNIEREVDVSDLAFRLIVSWNEDRNRLFMMWDRFDNIIDLEVAGGEGCCGQIDTIEFGVDGDNSGGIYSGHDVEEVFGGDEEAAQQAKGRQAQTAHMRFGATDGKPWKWNWQHEVNWDNDPPFSCCGDSFVMDGAHGTEGTTKAEWYITAWDEFDQDGVGESVEHDLQEGDIIGIQISPVDMDIEGEDDPGTKWSMGSPRDVWNNASSFTDFLLMPVDESLANATNVESDSWGHIKASFAK